MNFSKRILKIKPSPTLEVTALANSLRSKGINVIGFGAGEPDFDTPDFIKHAAINAINKGKTKYTPVGGIPELKEAIVDKFRKDNNLEYSTGEVTVNCGGKHSFYNLMQVLLNAGDEVILTSPYWVSYPSMILLAGGKPVSIETNEDSGFKITPDDIERAITNKTRAIVINSPSNPTGAAYTKEELKGIAHVLKQYDILIVTDDIYEFWIYDNLKFYNIANLSDEMMKRTIVLNGISKTYSMTGWRIGYMAGNEEIMKKVEILQSQSTSNPASISQWAAVEAIRGDQSFISKWVKEFQNRRDMIVEKLNQIQGIICKNPEGAFYVFPCIKGVFEMKGWQSIEKKYKNKFNSSKLSSYLLEEAKVAVVPGVAFGSDNNIRLSFAISDDNIAEGLNRIKKAIELLN